MKPSQLRTGNMCNSIAVAPRATQNRRAAACLGLCLLSAACCLARDFTLQSPTIIEPGTRVAVGKSQKWTFPAVSAKPGEATVLRFFLRMDTPTSGGCNFAMKVLVNGKPLQSRGPSRSRLLSHARSFHLHNWESTLPTYANGLWIVMYAPDFEPKQVVEGDDCLYAFDVTDLVKATGTNELIIEHHGEALSEVMKAPIPFVIKDLAVGAVPEAEIIGPPKDEKPLPYVAGVKLSTPRYDVTAPGGGGLEVQIGGETFFVDSRFTYPNAGWNCLSPAASASGESGWKPVVKKAGANRLEVTAEGSLYRLKRIVELTPQRVVVSDEFTNKTQNIIGMRLRNQVNAVGQSVVSVSLAGNSDVDEVSPSLDNPTAFVQLKGAGIGLLAEDDVYRVQSLVYNEPPFAGVGSNELGLGPGKSCTVRWAIYPTKSGSAYDFINQVRRDWGVNDITIDGPGVWLDAVTVSKWDDEQLTKWLALRSAKIVLLSPWMICLDIPHIGNYPKFKPLLKTAIERIHYVRPGTKVLCLIHPTMNFCKPGGDYDSDAYKDSFILNPDGSHFWSDYYSKSWFTPDELKEGWRNYCNYAMPRSAYFKWLMGWIDRSMNECGADGIYSDEFNHFNNVSPTTYGEWDGHSVKVDAKTFVPDTSKLFCRLIYKTEATQQAIVDRVTRRGGIFLANSHPGLRSLQQKKFLAFCEIGDLNNCHHTHLFTPIGLGWSPGYGAKQWDNDGDLFQNVRDQVEHATLYYFYSPPELKHETVVGKMYPFTVVDIRPGILTGKERIITTRSGKYGWGEACNVKVWIYDSSGALQDPSPATRTISAKQRLEVTVPEGGMVVLER